MVDFFNPAGRDPFGAFGEGQVRGEQIRSIREQRERQSQQAQKQSRIQSILGQLSTARGARQQAPGGPLSQQAQQPDRQDLLGQLSGEDPATAIQFQKFFQGLDKADRDEQLRENDVLTRIALDAKSLPENQRRAFVENERSKIAEEGTDVSNLTEALQQDDAGFQQTLDLQARAGLSLKQLAERQFPEEKAAGSQPLRFFQPITLVNPETGEKRLVSPTGDPATGRAFLSPLEIAEGFEVSTETTEEKRAADVLAAGEKIGVKGRAQRLQTLITDGVTLAEGSAVLRRALTLLDTVKTGGIASLALKVKQLTGTESADEGDLTNLLLKNVLSQLRPTFGAQFTEREGALLTRIEASTGKSAPANRRLLERLLKAVDRDAQRGIDAAIEVKDFRTAADIQELMKFSFEPEQAQQPEATPGAAAQQQGGQASVRAVGESFTGSSGITATRVR